MKHLKLIYLAVAGGILWFLWSQYRHHVAAAAEKAKAASTRESVGPNSAWHLPWESAGQDYTVLAQTIANALGQTPLTVK